MNAIDWTIILVYMLGMVGLSVWLGRGQTDADDYYVGGRNLPWWAVGISTMATQTSVVSFVSIPAFVALKPGGGLTWLQYELAVPLAMIAVMVLLVPFFRRLELVSVYEYLELRFGPGARVFLSAVFLISRGLGTAVGLYMAAAVLEVSLGLPLEAMILLVGVVTVIYDTIGGMTAVVYSDVVQMAILLGGIVVCIYYGADAVGGFGAMMEALPAERWTAYAPGTGLGDGATVPFWGFLVGGFFLYTSYYGVDQSQAQRELSAPTTDDTKRSLVFNGLARFPLTLLYLGLGIAVGAVFAQSPELQASVDKPDQLVPRFILSFLPTGVRAVLLAAMLAAAMSSLDSALNSLSAATMRDFIEKYRPIPPEKMLSTSRWVTIVWGVILTALAFGVDPTATVVETINKVGSAFYGPILAAFVVGVLSKRATARAVIVGVLAGVGFNVMLWLRVETWFWMWWNAFGLVVTAVVTLALSRLEPAPSAEVVAKYTLSGAGLWADERRWLPTYAMLVGYFVVILMAVLFVHHLAG